MRWVHRGPLSSAVTTPCCRRRSSASRPMCGKGYVSCFAALAARQALKALHARSPQRFWHLLRHARPSACAVRQRISQPRSPTDNFPKIARALPKLLAFDARNPFRGAAPGLQLQRAGGQPFEGFVCMRPHADSTWARNPCRCVCVYIHIYIYVCHLQSARGPFWV